MRYLLQSTRIRKHWLQWRIHCVSKKTPDINDSHCQYKQLSMLNNAVLNVQISESFNNAAFLYRYVPVVLGYIDIQFP